MQTIGALFMTFNPCHGSRRDSLKVLQEWLTRLFFGTTFFALPLLAWIHGGLAHKSDTFADCHLNVWFMTYWLLNLWHVFIGIYASIRVAVGNSEEVAIEIQA